MILVTESKTIPTDKPHNKPQVIATIDGNKFGVDTHAKSLTETIGCPKEGKIFPDSFGLDKIRIRVKQKGSEKLKGSFLPFTMVLHSCKVIFEDKEYGRFCYEFVGEVTLPPVFAEHQFNVPVDGSQVKDICII